MSDMRLTNTSVVRAGGRLLARATSGARMLPGFLVIGTKRGGSTSLYEYLIRHPDVAGCLLTKGSHYFDVNFGRGWSWFRAAFPLAGGRRAIAGEASPYYMFHPLAPQRIAAARTGAPGRRGRADGGRAGLHQLRAPASLLSGAGPLRRAARTDPRADPV